MYECASHLPLASTMHVHQATTWHASEDRVQVAVCRSSTRHVKLALSARSLVSRACVEDWMALKSICLSHSLSPSRLCVRVSRVTTYSLCALTPTTSTLTNESLHQLDAGGSHTSIHRSLSHSLSLSHTKRSLSAISCETNHFPGSLRFTRGRVPGLIFSPYCPAGPSMP